MYLWVDSLCIVQDDPIARDCEIANMSSLLQARHSHTCRGKLSGFVFPTEQGGLLTLSPRLNSSTEPIDQRA
jgi:hypothetical protein